MSRITRTIHKATWLAGVGAMVVFSGSSVAAPLGLQDVPLFLSTGAEPNVMLMVDNSGSMSNIVPDEPYDPNTVYLTSCPSTRRVSTSTEVQLNVVSGAPRIRYGGTNYVHGTGSGERCFDSDADYMAKLYDDDAFGYLAAQYTGNYLNWYFSTSTDPSPCSNTWSSGRKPCTQTRLMIAKTAGKNLVDSMPTAMRVGLSTYNNGNGGRLLSEMGNLTSGKRTALKSSIDAMTASGNTPLAETLSDIGYYFSRGATNLTLHPDTNPTTVSRSDLFSNGYTRHSSWGNGSNPIAYSCQKSFAVMLTDGRPQGDRHLSSYLRDYDNDCPNCSYDMKPDRDYESQGSDYLDDVAQALFEMDLRPDLVDPLGAKNNVATYLISFADDQAINDPLMEDSARQGGGEKFTAGNETQLTAAFQSALSSIVQRSASASSASVNSGSISSETRVYQAKFNSGTWTGQLLSFPVGTSTGDLAAAEWDASRQLPAADARRIITVNSDGTPVPFAWAELDATRQGQLDPNPAVAELMLNYLRGDGTNEGSAPSNFRIRQDAGGPNKLGDIISSAPLFVGRPPFRYRDSMESVPYSNFATAHENRTGMVYVGANDGMLHGFDATTGREVFAFVPSAVFPRLRNLTSKTYAHEFYVDGSPSMADVFYSGAWHTVLVGGLNKGGREVYALDITNVGTLANAEGNASSIVLWEFTHEDDPDLGLTYSQPTIAKLQNGTWAAIFGNGYNSPDGKAVLYVVDIRTGNLIRKFDTGTLTAPSGVTWDNGLSTPAAVDTNGDRVVDYVFAGDLFGNMWKFDLTDESSDNWSIAFGGAPLYQARDANGYGQPITVRPEVARGPYGSGMIVLFGTGKYLELIDKEGTPVRPQTFYGIIDRGSSVADRSSLRSQQITHEFRVDPDGAGPIGEIGVRVTTQNELGANAGWYIDLVSPGGYQAEKQVTNPVVRDGKIVFTTLIPNTDPCGAGGTSWLMELDLLSGARLVQAPFDINQDGEFNDADKVVIPDGPGAGTSVDISGIQWSEAGILQSPGIIEGETEGGACVQYKYMPDSAGNIQRINENCGPGGMGRQSWRQLR